MLCPVVLLWLLLPASAWSNQFQETKLRKIESKRRMRIKMEIQITLKEVLKSWISKDQKDRFSKGGRSISNWSQYYHVNSICILQCQHNCLRLQVGTRFSFYVEPRLWYHSVTPRSYRYGDVTEWYQSQVFDLRSWILTLVSQERT